MTEVHSMVEKVAQAIEVKLKGQEFPSYEDAARAAIEAMGELTSEMLAAGRDAIEPYVMNGLSKPVSDQWQIAREAHQAMTAAAVEAGRVA